MSEPTAAPAPPAKPPSNQFLPGLVLGAIIGVIAGYAMFGGGGGSVSSGAPPTSPMADVSGPRLRRRACVR